MFERFSATARAVVTAARAEAVAAGSQHIGTEHLLLAAVTVDAGNRATLAQFGIDEPRVRAAMASRVGPAGDFGADDAAALAAIGIDLDAVLARMSDQLGAEPSAMNRTRRLKGMSPHAKKALQLALREAIWLKDRSIGVEHLLLGILRAGDGRACRILDDLQVDRDELRKALLRSVSKAA
jgi:ATP-dependent Clp protease ATP-binding subunit ClpA